MQPGPFANQSRKILHLRLQIMTGSDSASLRSKISLPTLRRTSNDSLHSRTNSLSTPNLERRTSTKVMGFLFRSSSKQSPSLPEVPEPDSDHTINHDDDDRSANGGADSDNDWDNKSVRSVRSLRSLKSFMSNTMDGAGGGMMSMKKAFNKSMRKASKADFKSERGDDHQHYHSLSLRERKGSEGHYSPRGKGAEDSYPSLSAITLVNESLDVADEQVCAFWHGGSVR